MVSDDTIIRRLHQLLDESDLNVTTEKQIRLQLQEEFDVDLCERKKFLREEIQNYLNSRPQEEEPEPPAPPPKRKAAKPKEKKPRKRADTETPDGEEKKKRGGGGLMKLCALSNELADFLGVAELPRTEVVQGVWKYIKEHNLQDPANKRVIICDATLEKLLGAPSTDMFQLNKLLKPHIHTIPGDGPAPPAKKAKVEEAPRVEPPANGGNAQSLQLSQQLRRFLNTGETALPRTEVVKRVWNYVKENNLLDQDDHKTVVCDDALADLLGVESFPGVGVIPKLLAQHLGKISGANSPQAGSEHGDEGQESPETNGHDAHEDDDHGEEDDNHEEGGEDDYE